MLKTKRCLTQSVTQWVSDSVRQWLCQWQGHLLSCLRTAKKTYRGDTHGVAMSWLAFGKYLFQQGEWNKRGHVSWYNFDMHSTEQFWQNWKVTLWLGTTLRGVKVSILDQYFRSVYNVYHNIMFIMFIMQMFWSQAAIKVKHSEWSRAAFYIPD